MKKLKNVLFLCIIVLIVLFMDNQRLYASEEKKTFDVIYIEREFTYTGEAIDFSKIIWVVDENGNYLVEGVDFVTECYDNINAGEGILVVTGIGEYTGISNIKFKINKAELKYVKIEEIPEQEYTGYNICPELKLKYVEEDLEKNIDYMISFSNNISCGIANIEITGIGNYEGTLSKSFRIVNYGEKKKISNVSLYSVPQIYVGRPIELSAIMVKNVYGDILVKGIDYTIEYIDNVNVGEATVIVTGIGNYIGTIIDKFEIIPTELFNVDIEEIQNQKYTGKEICPKVKAKYGSMILEEGIDYKVEYLNNISVGTAKVKLVGIGNYTGSVIKTFKIKYSDNKEKQTIKAENVVKKYSKKSFNLQVTVKGGAKLKFTSSNKKVVTINSKGRISIKGAGKSIIKIMASENEKYRSAEKKITVSILPGSPEFLLSDLGNNSIKVKWAKGSGIGENRYSCKYYIKYSTDKNFKGSNTIVVTGNNNSRVIKGLKSGNVYYIKMRTYSVELKKYSSWTNYRKISI